MTYLKYVVSSLAIAAGLGLSSLALAQTQANINWLPTGVDNWKSDPNWEDVGFGNFIPEAQYDDRAIIASGGTAQVIDSPPAVGGIEVNDGTLEITATGTLVSRLGDSGLASGRVSVGAAGTLRIAGGGTMSVGENANPANLSLGGVYSVELTAAAQNPISVAGKAVLGGALVADFNGATVTPSSTWKLIDATNLTGNFNSFTTSGATLPLGKVFNLQQTSGGTNGNLLQIGVEQRLVLNLNRDTKIASIQNVGTSAVSLDFDSYLVESAVGSINPTNWNSLEDQGFEDSGNPWAEGGSAATTMNALNEFNPRTSATLAPGASRQLGSIYAPNYGGVPFGAEIEDHVFSYTNNGQTYQGVVNYTGEKHDNNIVLTVDPVSGEATMQNESGSGVAIDSYTIASEGGGLLTTWNSLEDQGGPGGTWLEANASANRLSEVTEEGATFLIQNEGFNLSTLFNTGSAQDLTFQFLVAGTTKVIDGLVVYGDLPNNVTTPSDLNQADFNKDTAVDGADLTAWQNGYGIAGTAMKSDGDFNNDSNVDGSDFLGWQRNFGNPGPGTATASAVPEPTSLALLLVGTVVLAGCRRQLR